MDSQTYRHLLGQLTKSCPIPHHNFPCHNLLSLETLVAVSKNLNSDAPDGGSEFLSNFPCYRPFPYEVESSLVLFCGSRAIDDATDLVKRKMNWERKLKSLRLSNFDLAVKHIKEIRKNRAVKISKNLKAYIEHFHCDPVPMFSGNYNWLYTGGSMSYVEDNNGVILISADYLNENPGFNLLKPNSAMNKVEFELSTQLKASSPVLQVSSRARQENMFICVRQKNHLSVFKVNKAKVLSSSVNVWRKKVLGSKLLTCSDINPACDEIIVSDSSHDIHVFHLEKKDKIYGHSGQKIASDLSKDCWNQVAFGELGIYWAARNCFSIFDVRDFRSKEILEFVPTIATNNCEEICSFIVSPCDSNYVYLGTTHSILQLDLRQGKPVQRWTHLMKNPPQFMTIIKGDEKNEILILQSQAVDEHLGIINEYTEAGGKANFTSNSLPCLLKSVKESLMLSRFHGVCLSPSVSKRMDFAVTGMQCLKNSQSDIVLFTKNSGGDIFVNKIRKSSSRRFLTEREEQEVLDSMKIYESHCERFPLKKSLAKSLYQLTDMSHVIKDRGRSSVKAEGKAEKLDECWKHHEMYSAQSLKFFKDVLARKILRVWDPSAEESVMSVDDKIREWMRRC